MASAKIAEIELQIAGLQEQLKLLKIQEKLELKDKNLITKCDEEIEEIGLTTKLGDFMVFKMTSLKKYCDLNNIGYKGCRYKHDVISKIILSRT